MKKWNKYFGRLILITDQALVLGQLALNHKSSLNKCGTQALSKANFFIYFSLSLLSANITFSSLALVFNF